MRTMKHAAALRHELLAEDRIPYASHVAPQVVRTTLGDYLQTFRLGGAAFESSDDGELNNWHERLNVLWRNIAGPTVALWTQVVRRRAQIRAIGHASYAGRCEEGFADRLAGRYHQRVGRESLMQNDIYLSVLYRPAAGLAAGLVSRVFSRTQRHETGWVLGEALDACEKLAQIMSASLVRYEPELLGCYRQGGAWYSSLLEYLGLLINGESQPMPLARKPLNQILPTGRLLFGTETIEYRSPTETYVGAMLGIKEYPTPTTVENCSNSLILRCSSGENGGTSQFASKLIGEREIIRRQTSRGSDREAGLTVRNSRRSKNISEQHVTEAAVMASQIEQLPDLCGYLKLASVPEWRKVAIRGSRRGRHRFS
jgi:type IV secretory pathway VirB4 component